MSKTFYNDALVGNSKTLACITRTGKLVRLFWPHIDYFQSINIFSCGIYLKNSDRHTVSWLHDRDWIHKQCYVGDTNILETTCDNAELGIKIIQRDYVVHNQDVVIRSYEIQNTGHIERELDFYVFSSLVSTTAELRNSLLDFTTDALIQYGHDLYIGIIGDGDITKFQIGNDALSAAQAGHLIGHNDIGMCPEAAVSWKVGKVQPGAKKIFNIYICLAESLPEVRKTIQNIRSANAWELLEDTAQYWTQLVQNAKRFNIDNIEMLKLYKRSILMLKLIQDKQTGGILASAEIDEDFSRCGRYGYCWCRDAVYIAAALDECGLNDDAEKFYEWAASVQEPNGSWLQRYHIDGNVAPSWGLQIDETGTVLWGMFQHYKATGRLEFLKKMWPCIRSAADFLVSVIDDETGIATYSYDLWEERFGQHAYSTAAAYGGLKAACKISELVEGDEEHRAVWKKAYNSIKLSIEKVLWDENLGRFVRSIRVKLNPWGNEPSDKTCRVVVNPKGYEREVTLVDYIIDISMLGLTIPFKVFDVDDPKIKTTVEIMEQVLANCKAGGVKRYENDGYIGGNPWIATTLWLSLYYIKTKNYAQAKKYLEWTLHNKTELYLLPEQVDRDNGGPAWVVPLAASHALFIMVLSKLSKANKI